MAWLLIALGGAAGTLLRYGAAIGCARWLGAAFPYGTLLVNLLGSFLLGIVAEAFSGATIGGTEARLVLGVGVLGGFTTYSSFNLELVRMMEQGLVTRGLLYAGLTVLGSLGAGALGIVLGRMLVSSSG